MRLLSVAIILACLSLTLGCSESPSATDGGETASADVRINEIPDAGTDMNEISDAGADVRINEVPDIGTDMNEIPDAGADVGINEVPDTGTDMNEIPDAGTEGIDANLPGDVGTDGDPCFGLNLCVESGWRCDGDIAVACWYDDNDCLVETRTDCSLQADGYCSTEGVIDGCRDGADACADMGSCPAERYCVGTVLHLCHSDENGCASVRAEHTCADEGKVCVETEDGAECVLAEPGAVSLQIATARAAIDSADRLPRIGDWDIEYALVTAVKGPLGADSGGFFLQGERFGPAIFVLHEDPVGVVEVGDEVSIWFEEVDLDQGRRVVNGLGWIDILSHDNDISDWAQDVSNIDIVTQLDDYEFELITLEAQVTGPFASAGPRFVDATLQSAGVIAGDLRLRIPTSLSTALLDDRSDLIGCTVRVGPSPLWRYFDRTQPTAMDASDINLQCP